MLFASEEVYLKNVTSNKKPTKLNKYLRTPSRKLFRKIVCKEKETAYEILPFSHRDYFIEIENIQVQQKISPNDMRDMISKWLDFIKQFTSVPFVKWKIKIKTEGRKKKKYTRTRKEAFEYRKILFEEAIGSLELAMIPNAITHIYRIMVLLTKTVFSLLRIRYIHRLNCKRANKHINKGINNYLRITMHSLANYILRYQCDANQLNSLSAMELVTDLFVAHGLIDIADVSSWQRSANLEKNSRQATNRSYATPEERMIRVLESASTSTPIEDEKLLRDIFSDFNSIIDEEDKLNRNCKG